MQYMHPTGGSIGYDFAILSAEPCPNVA